MIEVLLLTRAAATLVMVDVIWFVMLSSALAGSPRSSSRQTGPTE
jgi:hypothetical protein